jgi:hypothetical protein
VPAGEFRNGTAPLPSFGEVAISGASPLALARWLLTAEVGDAGRLPVDSAAALRVFHKLSQRMALLLSAVGSDALLRRAVHLSRAEFPFVGGIQTAPDAESLIPGLGQAATTVEPDQAHEGFVTVLGNLIALLDLLIGEHLAFRALQDVWPALPMFQPVQSGRTNGTGKLEAHR